METNTVSLKDLTPLSDFPGYYINLCNGNVYSYKIVGGWCKSMLLRKLEGKMVGRNNNNMQRIFTLKDQSGKYRYASHGRLMIAASRGLSYYMIPKDISCNYKNGRITMKNRADAAIDGWKNRLLEMNKNRIDNIRDNILCMCLLRKAFLGNRKPLFSYVSEKIDQYVSEVQKKVHWSRNSAVAAVEMATDYLYDCIKGEHAADIIQLDRWMVKTAIGLFRQELKRRKLDYSDVFPRKLFKTAQNKDVFYDESLNML